MPASAYVADARRKSFMDLPGETRKLIYGYAVFGNRSEDWGIMTSGDRLTCARPQSSDYGPSSRRFNIAFRTSMYGMFCAMRKLVRHEVRAYFWKHLDFKPASHCDLDDFLEDIGTLGGAIIEKIGYGPGRREMSHVVRKRQLRSEANSVYSGLASI
jgi:hypothetical protein